MSKRKGKPFQSRRQVNARGVALDMGAKNTEARRGRKAKRKARS